MARQKGYIHQFRIGVARQLADGRPEAELARDLGVSRKLLRDWQRLASAREGRSSLTDAGLKGG